MSYANYGNYGAVKAYQDLVDAEAQSVTRSSRHGPISRIRSAIASSLLLTGARIMPDAAAVVGNRIVVLERTDDERQELRSAA